MRIYQQYHKCGKSYCGICRDGPGHGPYLIGYERENGRARIRYLGTGEKKAPLLDPGKLREARLARGWTQQHVAELIGVATSNYTHWERGTCQPRPYARRKLVKLLQLDDLSGDEQDMHHGHD